MATRSWDREVTSVRLPLDERERADRLAAELGTSRSRLFRAAFAAIEREDRDVIRFHLTRLPDTKPPRTRSRRRRRA